MTFLYSQDCVCLFTPIILTFLATVSFTICLFELIFSTETNQTAKIAILICIPAFILILIMKFRFYRSIYRKFKSLH